MPGLLVYPAQNGTVATEYTVREQFPLRLSELPTDQRVDSDGSFAAVLEGTMTDHVADLIEGDPAPPPRNP